MKTATVSELRDRPTALLRGTEPILVTRRGRIVGIFVPARGAAVPRAVKRDVFYTLSSGIRRLVRERGLSERALLADFAKTRKARRRR